MRTQNRKQGKGVFIKSERTQKEKKRKGFGEEEKAKDSGFKILQRMKEKEQREGVWLESERESRGEEREGGEI